MILRKNAPVSNAGVEVEVEPTRPSTVTVISEKPATYVPPRLSKIL